MKTIRFLGGIAAAILTAALLLQADRASAVVIDVNGTNASGTTINLVAGTYTVTPIAGTFQAFRRYSYIGSCSGDLCGQGWETRFAISSPELSFSNEYGNQLAYISPEIALANAVSDSFTISYQQNVTFYVGESTSPIHYTDNDGGLTLRIEAAVVEDPAAVPAPATVLLFAGGLGLALRLRNDRQFSRAA